TSNHDSRSTDLRGHGEFRITEALAARHDYFTDARFTACENEVTSCVRGVFEGYAIAIDVNVFLHHDCVSALGDGRAGHDLDAGAGRDGAVEGYTCATFANQAQL